MNFITSTHIDTCTLCGGFLSIDSPRDLWIEKTCDNCGMVETGVIDLGEVIDNAQHQVETFLGL